MKVLVTGATGSIGSSVLSGLLEKNVPVRAMSRQPQKLQVPAGVEIAIGDLNEPESLNHTFEGVTAVFLYAQGHNLPVLVEKMKRGGVEYVVLLSTIDVTSEHDYAQHNRRRHLAIEEAIAACGFHYTYLRPGAFATNALRFWRDSIVTENVVRIPYPEAQQAPIDERDIAAVAVSALTARRLDGQAIVLTGPESLTQRQQVQCISSVVGSRIRIETVSEEQTRAWLGKIVPLGYVDLLVAQWRDEVGVATQITNNVGQITGRPATPYASWVDRNASAFRQP